MNDTGNSNKRRRLIRNGIVLITVIGAIALLGISSMAGRNDWPAQFQSNGERIYFTARSASGLRISAKGGTIHMGMMEGSSGCVTCHGADRQGRRLMHQFWKTTPPLTPDALFGEHAQDGHGDHDGYSDETLRRAISKGIDAGGKPLAQEMPKWTMSEQDLDDLIAFLKSPGGGRSH